MLMTASPVRRTLRRHRFLGRECRFPECALVRRGAYPCEWGFPGRGLHRQTGFTPACGLPRQELSMALHLFTLSRLLLILYHVARVRLGMHVARMDAGMQVPKCAMPGKAIISHLFRFRLHEIRLLGSLREGSYPACRCVRFLPPPCFPSDCLSPSWVHLPRWPGDRGT